MNYKTYKKGIVSSILLSTLLLASCATEIVEISNKASLKGMAYVYDEFINPETEVENINVELIGSDPLISVQTNSKGEYEISNIPTGTYNLRFSKEGYGENQYQGYPIVGGGDTLRADFALMRLSTATISNASIIVRNNTELYLSGQLQHNAPLGRNTNIFYFAHTDENPNFRNYKQIGLYNTNESSASFFESRIFLSDQYFPKGSQVNIVAYASHNYNFYFDIESQKIIYSNLTNPSNKVSLVIP